MFFLLFFLALFWPILPHAYEYPLSPKSVPAADLARFESWVQYAAAAYCVDNVKAKEGAKLSCPPKNCPYVQQADTSVILSFTTPVTDTAGFVAADHTHRAIVIAFRGTVSIRSIVFDWDPVLTKTNLCPGCMAEKGFWYSWIAVRSEILETVGKAIIEYPDYQIISVGHSLGGSIATLAAASLRAHGHHVILYSYGSARVGNRALSANLTAQAGNYRLTHTVDPIPKLPPLLMGYVHISPEYWITAPSSSKVQPDQINVLTGLVNWHGNTGTGPPLLGDLPAHLWYFQSVSLCAEPMPFQ
ncbi:Extracellular lipase [Aspergillus sclerotialis]|uniref:feruloyl esterase n=1 Tax=Aspergillus sclerotialis TaxID=2070753 RepID=A0A3A2ZKG7_9EURO|nr:Extracellular lipase [Aspergillus sclerotialis]